CVARALPSLRCTGWCSLTRLVLPRTRAPLCLHSESPYTARRTAMNWKRALLSRRSAPLARPTPRRWLPVFEALEDRLVLSGDLLVSAAGAYPQQVFQEFTAAGGLVRTVNVPAPPGTGGDTARDLVQDSTGNVLVYNGTFTPALATYNGGSGWTQQGYAG